MTSFARNGVFVLLGNVALTLFALATTAVLARIFSEETFGTYRFILATIPLLAIFTLPDMGSALTRAVAKRQSVALNVVLIEKIRYGLIGSLLAGLLSIYYFLSGDTVLGSLFAISLLFIPFFDVFLLYINALYGLKEFKLAVSHQTTGRLFSMCCLITAALLSKSIAITLVVFFAAQILPQIVSYILVRRKFFAQQSEGDTSILRYGKELTFIGGFSVLAASIDKIAVWYLLGPEALAFYVIALLMTLEASRTLESFSTVMFPYLAEAEDRSRISLLLQTLPALMGLLAIGAVLAALVIPYFLLVFFPDYTSVSFVAQISCLLLVLIPVNGLLYRYLVAEMRRRSMLYLHISKMTLFSILFLVLFDHGIMGALYALIATELASFGFLLFIAKHSRPVPGEVRVVPESRFSRKILVGRILRYAPGLKKIINQVRFITFRKRCATYPASSAVYSDGSWVSRKVTMDQRAIEQYLSRRNLFGKRMLHIGIGSSSLAQKYGRVCAHIDGVTVVEAERIHATELGIDGYHPILANKNDPSLETLLDSPYDYIIDNDIAGYACCKTHFEIMFTAYCRMLNDHGEILAGEIGAGYFDSGFPLPHTYTLTLARTHGLAVVLEDGVLRFSKANN